MKKKEQWIPVWHELKVAEGGAGRSIVDLMKEDGLHAKTCYSHFVGHIGVEVPVSESKKAQAWLDKNW